MENTLRAFYDNVTFNIHLMLCFFFLNRDLIIIVVFLHLNEADKYLYQDSENSSSYFLDASSKR